MTELLSSRRHRVRPPIMRSIPHISVTRGHTYAIMIFLPILRRPSPPQTPRETLATCREGKNARESESRTEESWADSSLALSRCLVCHVGESFVCLIYLVDVDVSCVTSTRFTWVYRLLSARLNQEHAVYASSYICILSSIAYTVSILYIVLQ